MISPRWHEDILPPTQRNIWLRLTTVPSHFVLYGGTAVALRLGNRVSVDFDFFSSRAFKTPEILRIVPWLADAEQLQNEQNTLTVVTSDPEPVQISFFGGLPMGRVGRPDRVESNGVYVASLLDLAATKARVVQERAESKDYLDLHAMLRAGIALEQALAAATALYGRSFNPAITLKALAYFEDGNLARLPDSIRKDLTRHATAGGDVPKLQRISSTIEP